MEAKDKTGNLRTVTPACSISEDEGLVTVKVEMPGVSKGALEIKIEGNELVVSGNRSPEAHRGHYILKERRAEAFKKFFTLDDSISRDDIDAALVDGILTLKLKVKEAAKPRRIEIA
jgi:HSP20 family protein